MHQTIGHNSYLPTIQTTYRLVMLFDYTNLQTKYSIQRIHYGHGKMATSLNLVSQLIPQKTESAISDMTIFFLILNIEALHGITTTR